MTTVVKENQLVVPDSVRRRARLKTGDRVEFKVSGGIITIIPKLPKADDEYTPEQRRIIHARLAKADADIKAGRVYGPFNTAEEMAASIEGNIKKFGERKRNVKPSA